MGSGVKVSDMIWVLQAEGKADGQIASHMWPLTKQETKAQNRPVWDLYGGQNR